MTDFTWKVTENETGELVIKWWIYYLFLFLLGRGNHWFYQKIVISKRGMQYCLLAVQGYDPWIYKNVCQWESCFVSGGENGHGDDLKHRRKYSSLEYSKAILPIKIDWPFLFWLIEHGTMTYTKKVSLSYKIGYGIVNTKFYWYYIFSKKVMKKIGNTFHAVNVWQ